MHGHDAGVSASLSPLQQWAAQAHEMYRAMRDAGFDDAEALALIAAMIARTD